MRELKVAPPDVREEFWNAAFRQAHGNRVAPQCACGLRMRKDDFNGMWFCRERGHGGYQTESQVASLLFKEMLRDGGYYDHD